MNTIRAVGLFGYIAGDFRSFRASAEIAYKRGFAQVYDLKIQEIYQSPYGTIFKPHSYFETIPTPYLPVFVVPFGLFLLINPLIGYGLWIILNIVVMILYIWHFLQKTNNEKKIGYEIIFLLTVSMPVFLNVLFGQVNVWLIVFFGEFIIASLNNDNYVGGLWLGGLLLKPQTLILLIPGLLISRRYKTLIGFILSSALIIGVSTALLGVEGITKFYQLAIQYPGNLATTNPQAMMNWRGIAIDLTPIISPSFAWGISLLMILITISICLWFWKSSLMRDPTGFMIIMVGTYATTCAVTWHSHVPMVIPLLIPLIYLLAKGIIPQRVIYCWVMLPAFVFFITPEILGVGAAHVWIGPIFLTINMGFVLWAFWTLRRQSFSIQPG